MGKGKLNKHQIRNAKIKKSDIKDKPRHFRSPTIVMPKCLHCGNVAHLVMGDKIYPHLKALHERRFWKCPTCPGSHVGTHARDNITPMGFPANAGTRLARSKLHKKLDPIWKRYTNKTHQMKARTTLYDCLSKALNLPRSQTHVGMFTTSQCEEAYAWLSENYPDQMDGFNT